jgi:hypothetical protein
MSEPKPVSSRYEMLQNQDGEDRFCRVVLMSDGTRRVTVIQQKVQILEKDWDDGEVI